MMIRFLPFLLIWSGSMAQSSQILVEAVQEVPSKTIYDLFLDRQNFLWIATEVGVYRYDGISFTPFASNEQSSLSVSGLSQDEQGRIWFHNFTGQIFYIEHDQTHLLRSYDSHSESRFGKIVVHKNFLYATSDKGLFVCDTRTLSGKYVDAENKASGGTNSLAILNEGLVAHGKNGWYIYRPGPHAELKQLNLPKDMRSYPASSLHPGTLGDTLLLFSNPSGTLTKLGVRGDSLLVYQRKIYKEFINTISQTSNATWINTQKRSTQLNGAASISGQNLSDVVKDHEGNIWFSSLNNGLLVKKSHTVRQRIILPGLPTNDIVRTMAKHRNMLLMGTQNGRIYAYDYKLNDFRHNLKFPEDFPSIRKIAPIDESSVMIGTPIHTYEYSILTGKLQIIPTLSSLKQIDSTHDLIFATTANGLVILLRHRNDELRKQVVRQLRGVTEYHEESNLFRYGKRCDALAYHPGERTLFVAFKNELFSINEKGITPVLFRGKPVYCEALRYYNNKIYVGTVNDGLLVYHNQHISQFTVEDGLLSNSILKLRESNNAIWLLTGGAVQVLDVQKNQFGNSKNLSTSDGVLTTDLLVVEDQVYLATVSGLFKIALNEKAVDKPLTNYLYSVLVNNRMMANQHVFDRNQNNIQFTVSVPVYNKARQTFIKYCLTIGKGCTWNVTSPGMRTITFASLAPGKYTLKAFAVNPELGIAKIPIIYHFEILHSWWQNPLFQNFVIGMFICFVSYLIFRFIVDRRHLQRKIDWQQQVILEERQRISSEIHDDIGAGIFAIRLFAEVASRQQNPRDELTQIAQMINDISNKIRGTIWTTDVENDTLIDLITYIKDQAYAQFAHVNVDFVAHIPNEIPEVVVSGRNRREISLIVKELIHNAHKHSDASKITLEIHIKSNSLRIWINDNGKGFDYTAVRAPSMGLKNAEARIRRLKGKIKVQQKGGTQVFIEIPLNDLGV
ncbi:ATP-binding protein [Dyadobacter sp. CY323]|uniref:sensor histidine kinase n=1 Tax=Dyadobacter sp. CY323 TaxID=2907302 RepID=UPI001F489CBF|nr:ATP-binding protein [Dyadobacter sp. CY323]MCE6991507.1 histidine kinase [Dyadobacter sp. CY323]